MVFFKKNWAFILVSIIILIFTLQAILYYATFKNLDFGWSWFPALADKEWLKDSEGNFIDDGLEGKWGAFGDFIGGILNPILGFITIILLLIAHQKDNKRDENYARQREVDLFLSRIEQLKQSHNEHIKNLHLIIIDKSDENTKYEFVQ